MQMRKQTRGHGTLTAAYFWNTTLRICCSGPSDPKIVTCPTTT